MSGFMDTDLLLTGDMLLSNESLRRDKIPFESRGKDLVFSDGEGAMAVLRFRLDSLPLSTRKLKEKQNNFITMRSSSQQVPPLLQIPLFVVPD